MFFILVVIPVLGSLKTYKIFVQCGYMPEKKRKTASSNKDRED